MPTGYEIEKSSGGHPWDNEGEYSLVHIRSASYATYCEVCRYWASVGYHCWIDGKTSDEKQYAACYFKLMGERSPEDEDEWE